MDQVAQGESAKSSGIFLILDKKSSGMRLAYQEILETAICFGWIDAIRKSATESTYLQRFTPRAKKSIWSKINRDKATALIESGRMLPWRVPPQRVPRPEQPESVRVRIPAANSPQSTDLSEAARHIFGYA